MRAAYENKVKKCILLSTDKAVYPINAMGMTKALSEKLMRSNSRIFIEGKTIFVQLDMVMLLHQGDQSSLYL